MAPWVEVLATKPDSLSSIPGAHMVKGENQLPGVVLISADALWHTRTFPTPSK